jgi:hypothetical protein
MLAEFINIIKGKGSNDFRALMSIESDDPAFVSAKNRAQATGEPQTFVINDKRYQTTFDGHTSQTESLGSANQKPA